MDGSGNFWVQQ